MVLVGNEKNKNNLDDILSSGQNSHAYLFVGPRGVGKTSFAKYFAQGLICDTSSPCGICINCNLFLSGNHPDVIISDEEDALTVDRVREMISALSLKPYQAKKKVLILANAERMTTSAANSLLKTLEEPANGTIIILTSSSSDTLLPTIISRVQAVKFSALHEAQIFEYFSDYDKEKVERAATLANNRIGLVKKMLEDCEYLSNLESFVTDFNRALTGSSIWQKIQLAEKISRNKEEISLLLDVLEKFYRKEMLVSDDVLKISGILDKLTKTRDLINKNVNKQLAMEYLLF